MDVALAAATVMIRMMGFLCRQPQIVARKQDKSHPNKRSAGTLTYLLMLMSIISVMEAKPENRRYTRDGS